MEEKEALSLKISEHMFVTVPIESESLQYDQLGNSSSHSNTKPTMISHSFSDESKSSHDEVSPSPSLLSKLLEGTLPPTNVSIAEGSHFSQAVIEPSKNVETHVSVSADHISAECSPKHSLESQSKVDLHSQEVVHGPAVNLESDYSHIEEAKSSVSELVDSEPASLALLPQLSADSKFYPEAEVTQVLEEGPQSSSRTSLTSKYVDERRDMGQIEQVHKSTPRKSLSSSRNEAALSAAELEWTTENIKAQSDPEDEAHRFSASKSEVSKASSRSLSDYDDAQLATELKDPGDINSALSPPEIPQFTDQQTSAAEPTMTKSASSSRTLRQSSPEEEAKDTEVLAKDEIDAIEALISTEAPPSHIMVDETGEEIEDNKRQEKTARAAIEELSQGLLDVTQQISLQENEEASADESSSDSESYAEEIRKYEMKERIRQENQLKRLLETEEDVGESVQSPLIWSQEAEKSQEDDFDGSEEGLQVLGILAEAQNELGRDQESSDKSAKASSNGEPNQGEFNSASHKSSSSSVAEDAQDDSL
jgi:hypothetical protein